jgi:hypothetical protein
MIVVPQGSSLPLRGDLIVSAVLRSDLTPVPASIELEVLQAQETESGLVPGGSIFVGPDAQEFELVKVHRGERSGAIQGDREVFSIKAVGLLKSCARIAAPLSRSVVMEGQSLGAIYRACGAQARIESDFQVGTFACFAGMTPSFIVAKVLQEEGGVLVHRAGRIQFRRLREIMEAGASMTMPVDSGAYLSSEFLERHAIPAAISTAPNGGPILGRTASGLGFVYRPRADQRIANNMSTALMQRRRVDSIFSPSQAAGDRVDIEGKAHVIITAAHVYEGAGVGAQYSRFWLGELQ